ncbi:hypothetical protein F5148DRAFT_569796 [Russula earlei]|uniref:Uncharacterized protein n=1 Tax=Russula earlei TaxID=71964 RepID=A0ACC0UG32_9AGAM|nr:hypothetical protein F5148DRAFT_569796 [Russula earlei]
MLELIDSGKEINFGQWLGDSRAWPFTGIHRRPGVSTGRFVISDASAIDQLPHGIRLMRDGQGEKGNANAAVILRLVASLRDSIVHMPPVFGVRKGCWDILTQFHSATNAGWTFAYTMQGLVELASCLPEDTGASINFSQIPTESVNVVTPLGEPVDTSLWHAGARCVAFYCLQILLALP